VSDNGKRYTNALVAKCEQILCVTSCEFDERTAKPKFEECIFNKEPSKEPLV